MAVATVPTDLHIVIPHQHGIFAAGKYHMPIGQAHDLICNGYATVEPQDKAAFEAFKADSAKGWARQEAENERGRAEYKKFHQDRVKKEQRIK